MLRLKELEAKILVISRRLKNIEKKNLPNRVDLKEEWIFLVAEADLLRPEEDEKKWNRMYPTLWWTRP